MENTYEKIECEAFESAKDKKTIAERIDDFFFDWSNALIMGGCYLALTAITLTTVAAVNKASKNGLVVNVYSLFSPKSK